MTSGESGILLDCGPGVLARFQEFLPLTAIKTVILSHLHFDHISDFLVLRYAVSPDGRYQELPGQVTVYAPDEPVNEFTLLSYRDAVKVVPVSPSGNEVDYARDPGGNSVATLNVGGMRISFYRGEHPYPSYAMRIEDGDSVLAYSGDSRPCQGLLDAAAGADVFLCEASAVEKDAEFARAGHLTAKQAGEIALKAGVKKLLLTHIWPLYDEAQILEECRMVFPRSEIVSEGQRYVIG